MFLIVLGAAFGIWYWVSSTSSHSKGMYIILIFESFQIIPCEFYVDYCLFYAHSTAATPSRKDEIWSVFTLHVQGTCWVF